jgi:anti-anti-sigma factor
VSETPSQPLSIDISFPIEGVALVELAGELEVVSVDEFSVRMADLGGSGPAGVVIDLAGISFIDSSGINALVQAIRAVEARGGTAVLASPSSVAQRVFAITRLAEIVPVETDRTTALARAAPRNDTRDAAG